MLASIYFIGIAQGLLLCILFFSKSKREASFWWLGALILNITIMISGQWLFTLQWHLDWWPLYLFSSGSVFLIGPLLYGFIRKKNKVKPHPKTVIHLAPAGLYYLLLVYALFPFSTSHIQDFLLSITASKQAQGLPFLGLIKLFHLLCYTLLSYKAVQHKKASQETKLLYLFILGYISLQGMAWLMIIASVFVNSELLQLADHSVSILLVLYVYLFGYISMEKPDFWKFQASGVTERYQTGGLGKNESAAYFEQLTQIMEKDKPYLEPTLNLAGLASLLKITPHQTSQVINENAGTNFSDYVNAYRVDTVKELLTEPQFRNYTLLAIAFEAGFNNKNSFNTAFKKHVGKTPTAYRKAIC
ncbi:helix-turn-helix domain-containing protein [Litoribacter populi]|uniref:helix-turn-helix domain-containing protein n=1 Tax=Litoribacter populi TaxID=2598460 RepID=UPI00117C4324|nr:helix-turn-helix domain-containing protein [Litoribacter populi]